MRERLSLFEVLHKAPQAHGTKGAGPFDRWRRRSKSSSSAPIVAEPLTEEEAAAAIAAEQVALEEAESAQQALLQEKLEKKSAKKAARLAARQVAEASAEERRYPGSGKRPMFSYSGGRVVFSLDTTGSIVIAALVCLVGLGGYSLGRKAATVGGGTELPTVAAIRSGNQTTADPLGILQEAPANARAEASGGDPDLSRLLAPPESASPTVMANQPARVDERAGEGDGGASKLNYLEVQNFVITRERSSEDLREDVQAVRRFLAQRGIETFARRLPKGFRLYAARGYSPSKESRPQREAFRRQIEQFGEAYRRTGGRYEFKGCFFVSHKRAMAGKPV